MVVVIYFFFAWPGSNYADQPGLELAGIHLLLPLEFWDKRSAANKPRSIVIFNIFWQSKETLII